MSELEGDGFGGSWVMKRCQRGAEGSGRSGEGAGRGREGTPASGVAANRGGGGEMRLEMAVAVVKFELGF